MNTLPPIQLVVQLGDRSVDFRAVGEHDIDDRSAGKGIAAGVMLGILGWMCLALGLLLLLI